VTLRHEKKTLRTYTGWPNKKLYTSELSWNRIENPPVRLYFKTKFECKRITI